MSSLAALGFSACGQNAGAPRPSVPTDLDSGDGVPLRRSLDGGWRFVRDVSEDASRPELDDRQWEPVTLPHTAHVEALVTGRPGTNTFQWQGDCWYRTILTPGPEVLGRRVFLRFEGAMNVADVWLDGEYLGQHLGGYLPFGFDVSGRLRAGQRHLLAVKLDNRDNPVTGPKPLADLDFNMYGGLYRSVVLITKGRLHISDPIVADRTASGGVFVRYPSVSRETAQVEVQVHVQNADIGERRFVVRLTLADATGAAVVSATSEPTRLAVSADLDVTQTLRVDAPRLWSPRDPQLYSLRVELVDGAAVLDVETLSLGIRHVAVVGNEFRINGELTYLRGTNHHQEYPYVGYALSDAAQYREVRKIKEAGFDFVRLAHHPHATAFLDACDTLGVLVMNPIPGWQYFNPSPEFAENQYDNCRRLLRRDRNHACVVLWEVSLNESGMPPEFVERANAIAHDEYPGDQCITAGWTSGYDVFIQARQHGGCHEGAGPCLVSEYGDWEYYAQNAGFRQEGWDSLTPDEANSRQLRWHGERALLQQATNFQEAASDNRSTRALGDGAWLIFDYNRGYEPDIESSGCMDIMRWPKFSYHFFRSQRPPEEQHEWSSSGPMVFIANYWTVESTLDVRVFSNASEVELLINGESVGRRGPDTDRISIGLPHPPFTFSLAAFAAGSLEAVAYIDGLEVARHEVRTPGPIATLELALDDGGRVFAAEGKDTVFVHGVLRDAAGTLVVGAWENISFGATGAVQLIGDNPFSSEAGVSSILLEAAAAGPRAALYALALVPDGEGRRALAASLGVGSAAEEFALRITTDGSPPTLDSAAHTGPVVAARVRVGLFVAGVRVVEADSDTPRFRVQGSTAPS